MRGDRSPGHVTGRAAPPSGAVSAPTRSYGPPWASPTVPHTGLRENTGRGRRTPVMGARIYVGNLPFTADEAQVRSLFEQNGRSVREVKIIEDRDTGRPRGFAFVEMTTDNDAKAAISELHGANFGGRTLTVNEARRARGPRWRRRRRWRWRRIPWRWRRRRWPWRRPRRSSSLSVAHSFARDRHVDVSPRSARGGSHTRRPPLWPLPPRSHVTRAIPFAQR